MCLNYNRLIELKRLALIQKRTELSECEKNNQLRRSFLPLEQNVFEFPAP
jgi:hypothetical protein